MDARDKILPALRSGGRYVVELYNTVRPQSSIGYRPPAPQTMNRFLTPLDQAAQMQKSLHHTRIKNSSGRVNRVNLAMPVSLLFCTR